MSDRSAKTTGTKPATERACPICGKPGIAAFRPFCSARCQDVDLHRWLAGAYAIPAADEPDADGSEEPE